MRRFLRSMQVVGVLLLASIVIMPALSKKVGGQLAYDMQGWLRNVSLSQYWGMYAPNPQRSTAYLELHAELDDGTRVPLDEAVQARDGWGALWAGDKRRTDIWRHYVGYFSKRTRDRTWYLRGVCVRETRRLGQVPVRIEAVRVRRRFTHPKSVAKGNEEFSKLERTDLGSVHCRTKYVTEMIEGDRERNGTG